MFDQRIESKGERDPANWHDKHVLWNQTVPSIGPRVLELRQPNATHQRAVVAVIALLLVPGLAQAQTRQETDAIYFPPIGADWARVAPSTVGWNPQLLERALDYAPDNRSSSVVILLDGRIRAERIWQIQGTSRYERMKLGVARSGHTIEDVGSAQKSIVAALAGIAEAKALLGLGARLDRYIGKGWSKSAAGVESAITVSDVMAMVSGLTDELEYEAPVGRLWRYIDWQSRGHCHATGRSNGRDAGVAEIRPGVLGDAHESGAVRGAIASS